MREHLATRRGHATIGQPSDMPWLFPGGRSGHPLDAGRIGDRLKAIGLHPRADRAVALFTLAADLPAAILPRMLGISIRTPSAGRKPPPATGWPTLPPSADGSTAAVAAAEPCPAGHL